MQPIDPHAILTRDEVAGWLKVRPRQVERLGSARGGFKRLLDGALVRQRTFNGRQRASRSILSLNMCGWCDRPARSPVLETPARCGATLCRIVWPVAEARSSSGSVGR